MVRVNNKLLPVALIVVACGALCSLVFQDRAFVPTNGAPASRREVVAGFASVGLVASVASPEPAQAIKFSFFGYGEGIQDPYANLDKDSETPYDPFPNSADSDYNRMSKNVYIQKKKDQIDEILAVIEAKVPKYIKEKDVSNIKSPLTLQGGALRINMQYVTCGDINAKCDTDSREYKKVRDVFQDFSDTLTSAYRKDFASTQINYNKAMRGVKEWKEMVNY